LHQTLICLHWNIFQFQSGNTFCLRTFASKFISAILIEELVIATAIINLLSEENLTRTGFLPPVDTPTPSSHTNPWRINSFTATVTVVGLKFSAFN